MTKALCKDIKKRGKWTPAFCEICKYQKRCKEKGGVK